MIVKLTQQLVDRGLPPLPAGKRRLELCCSELPGLILEVRATNPDQGTYYLRYKNHHGKTCYSRIGNSRDTSVFDAHKKAKALKLSISGGADPSGEEKARKEVLTFDEFFEKHYLPYVKPRKRSWKRDEELYRLRTKAVFGHLRLNQITRQQIQLFHTALFDQGLAPSHCDLYLRFIRHALNLSIDWNLLTEKNPAARIPLFNVDNRVENLLTDAELDRLVKVLRTDRNRAASLIALFLMSTGARAREVTEARWVDIDRENRRWYVPMTNSKSKRSRWVPLTEASLLVLDEIGTEGLYEHVFVNRRTGKPYLSIAMAWKRLRKKADLPHVRVHDLRHGFATMLASAGRSLIEIGELLGHAKGSAAITGRYIHLAQGQLREASAVASLKIMGTVQAIPKQAASDTAAAMAGATPVAEVETDAAVSGTAAKKAA